MGEINDFYIDFEKELDSFEEISSYTIKNANRIDNSSEKRSYELYIKSWVSIGEFEETLVDRLPLTNIEKSNQKLLVTVNYDKDIGSTWL
jgi:hypothetical protein